MAIEVDGPSHFLANIMDQRIGADRLRTEYLERKGWKVREPGATSQSRGGKRGGGQTLHPADLSLSVAGRVFFAREFFLSSRRSFFSSSRRSFFSSSRRRDDDRRILTLSAISLTANAREALKLQNI